VQLLHASYAQQLSLRDSVKCRRLIESPWYQSMWGDRFKLTSDQNTKTRFDNDKNGSRLSTSVGSALTGEGGSIIVVDDPNAAQEAFSEATIASTIDWWDSALSTRLNDPKTGAYVVIQQRLSEEDLTGHIMSKDMGEWTHLCLPMRYEWQRHSYTSIGWNDPRGVDDKVTPLPDRDSIADRISENFEQLKSLQPGHCDECGQWAIKRVRAYWGPKPMFCVPCWRSRLLQYQRTNHWPEADWNPEEL
jgi:hypothetical protein